MEHHYIVLLNRQILRKFLTLKYIHIGKGIAKYELSKCVSKEELDKLKKIQVFKY